MSMRIEQIKCDVCGSTDVEITAPGIASQITMVQAKKVFGTAGAGDRFVLQCKGKVKMKDMTTGEIIERPCGHTQEFIRKNYREFPNEAVLISSQAVQVAKEARQMIDDFKPETMIKTFEAHGMEVFVRNSSFNGKIGPMEKRIRDLEAEVKRLSGMPPEVSAKGGFANEASE